MKQYLLPLTGLALIGGLCAVQVSGQSTTPLPTPAPLPAPVPTVSQPLSQGLTLGEGEDALVHEVKLADGTVCVALVGHTFGTVACRWSSTGTLLPVSP